MLKILSRQDCGTRTIKFHEGLTKEAIISKLFLESVPSLPFYVFRWTCPCGTELDTADEQITPMPVTGGCIYRCPNCNYCYSIMGQGEHKSISARKMPGELPIQDDPSLHLINGI
jgi:hypothetical protein